MKASQRDSSGAESRRERERLREEKDLQRIMGASGSKAPATSVGGIKTISLTPKPGFKKAVLTEAPSSTSGSTGGQTGSGGGAGGWKTVGQVPKKREAELSWGSNGEDPYDPAYPTPV